MNRLRNVFESGSRAGTPEEEPHSNEEDLLTAVVVLGIIVIALLLIIIYGWCKYVKGGRMEERRNSEAGESPGDAAAAGQLEPVPEVVEIPQEPVKSRKRSMTFTQNDEECRKYREDLADAYENDHRSRKKSTVTFAGLD